MQRHSITPQGREAQAVATSQPAPRIGVGDRVRIFDGLYCAYFWHEVTETITGARPQIKVNAYGFYIFAAHVSGHRKGGAR